MESTSFSADITSLPIEILVKILATVPEMKQVIRFVCHDFYEGSSLVHDTTISCGEYAAELGSRELVEWLLSEGCQDDFCSGAVRGGQLDLLQFLMEEKRLPFTYSIYKAAIKHNKTNILDWLIEHKLFDRNVFKDKRVLSKVNKLETLRWVLKHFTFGYGTTISDLYPACCVFAKRGQLEMIKEVIPLAKQGFDSDGLTKMLRVALSEGAIIGEQVEIIKFLREKNLYSLSACLRTAIVENKLAFFEKHCQKNEDYTTISDKYLYWAAEYGNLEAFQKMVDKSTVGSKQKNIYEIWLCVIQNGHYHFLDYLEDKFGKFQTLLEYLFPYDRSFIIADNWARSIRNKNSLLLDWCFVNMESDIFAMYPEMTFAINYVSVEWVIKKAIEKDNLSYLKKLCKSRYASEYNFEKDKRKIGASVTNHVKNNLRILNVLRKKGFPLDGEIIYQYALKENNLELLKWSLYHFDEVIEDREIEYYALDGDLGNVIMCLEDGSVFEEKIVGWAAQMGHHQVVQWLTINVLIPKFMN